ncbi:MAG TPA: flagellar hook capping protein [Planctomycetaceae bacterium]|nr:flagellar hook capping protein [Planctomycetaceae bacterium]
MEVNAAGTTGVSPTPDALANGLNKLTSEDFLKLLITQLQNQDPTEPMGNDELLSQISMLRDLQSNIELSDTLKAMSDSFAANLLSQQLSAAASLIGKLVTGKTENDDVITGVVDRAFLENGKVYVGIGDRRIELSKITSVEVQKAA